ncbi:hypothetical protein YT1_0243 [Rhodococcus ruber]|nr:hypothetical protein YT1_0243 [Rhodococcus ruber]CCW11899.1 hypothetical protein EBESD8_24430 [Rhodococcus aetherivorans]
MHLPVCASWLNQVEIFFSVLQRRAIAPVDFAEPRCPCHPDPGVRGPLQHHCSPVRLAVHAR